MASVNQKFIIHFIYESNMASGLPFTLEETSDHVKHYLAAKKLKAPILGDPRITNHYEAVKFVLENKEGPPTREKVSILHRILMKDISCLPGVIIDWEDCPPRSVGKAIFHDGNQRIERLIGLWLAVE